MKNTTEILSNYTMGKATWEEANAALESISSELRLNPEKNVLSEAELAETTVGKTAGETNGWGLLDIGIGCLEKVQVKDGKLIGTDVGEMYALFLVAGKTYKVKGDNLTEG